MDHLITPRIITNLFPKSNVHVKFAFFGAHIDRYRKLGKMVSIIFKSLKSYFLKEKQIKTLI
jgi:hypothetical protein